MRLTPEAGTYCQPGLITIRGSFQTNGSSAPTVIRDGNARLIGNSGSNGSVTRQAAGRYLVQLDTSSSYPVPTLPVSFFVDNHALNPPTNLVNAYYVEGSWNPTAKNFQIILVSGSPVPALVTGQAVSSNTCTLTLPGVVTQVQATAGTSAGIKTIILSGAPAAGQVAVTYSAGGVPTFTFNGADAITTCEYIQVSQALVDADATVRVDFEIAGSIESAGLDPA